MSNHPHRAPQEDLEGKGVSWTAQISRALLIILSLAVLPLGQGQAAEAANTLEAVDYSVLPGDRVRITLTLGKQPAEPTSFTIDDPARIALDFANTRNALDKASQSIGVGVARGLNIVEANSRTRVVLNLVELVPYETRVQGKKVHILLDGAGTASAAREGTDRAAAQELDIKDLDFHRTEEGAGRVIVKLSDAAVSADVRREGDKIIVDFLNATLPERLQRRLNVVDFATPVKTIDAFRHDSQARMVIEPETPFDHLAYQAQNVFTVEVKPVSEEEQRAREEEKYTGERLSLNFQDITVRSVLQLLADFTGLNIVVSDSVSGSLTLRLKNVPWDQALDIILKTKGLDMRRQGNVILVAPAEEIAAREKQELQAKQQLKELAPLRSEFIQVNYAKASDLAQLIKSKGTSLLSDRGNVTVDQRTNTLLVRDTGERLEEIRRLVSRLDIPVRQLLIESRIVIAREDFTKELGVRFGATVADNNGDEGIITGTGSIEGTDSIVNDAAGNLQSTGQPFPVDLPALNDRLAADLPVANPAGSIAVGILGADYLLDLELSAMQAEGEGEVISQPRVITANQKEASIEQGVEIPYQEATSSGATNVSFKEAELELRATPQITPDDRVIMDLTVKKNSVGEVFQGVPSINTREIATQVLVDNGETVVLGGVYERSTDHQTNRVPFFGDLPVVGHLFRNRADDNTKTELLIFVTPKIVKEGAKIQTR